MREYRFSSFLVLAVAGIAIGGLLFVACSNVSPYYDEGGKKDKRTMAEKEFDPMAFDGDAEPIVPQWSTGGSSPDSLLSNYNLIGGKDDSLQSSENYVYRVQVFASRFLQEAEVARDEMFGLFDETIYLDFEEPYYKIRIGNFETAEEGEEFLSRVRELGYTEVWLVKVRQE
ncbi:MAG: hypothetical protein GF307_04470 [candidate division Zixibacteria bacterium]|nr:hypothetical protein [candidate division Zixibacteria bacterium]